MNGIQYFFKVFKNYATFSGRARRSEYWYFQLFNMIPLIILSVLKVEGIPLPYTIYALGSLLPSLAVSVRRVHDVGKSGWFILIPIYNLILVCTNGDEGSNEYGLDPKNPVEEQGFDFDNNQFNH